MNQDQIKHENSIIEEFVSDHMAKYEKGCIEHGGGLWEVPADQLIEMAIEEVLDQASYLYTLKPQLQKLMEFKWKVQEALESYKDTDNDLYIEISDALEELSR